MEFIYGYPHLTMDMWVDTIMQAIELGVEEIQLYRLRITPYGSGKGAIEADYIKHPENYPTEEQAFLMKEVAKLLLNKHGYNENLTRVFTNDSKETSHYARDICCNLKDIVGFGPTAFSNYSDRHGRNERSLEKYYSLIDQSRLPLEYGKIRSKDDQLRWALIRPLKNSVVPKDLYKQKTGEQLGNVFQGKINILKKYDLISEDEKKIMLTTKGRFFADEVCQQFYHPDFLPSSEEGYADGELSPYKQQELYV